MPARHRRHARHSALSLAAALLIVAGLPPAAAAQTASRFYLGPIGWTPVVTLREAGFDSNVFNASSEGRREEDRYGVLQPQVDAAWSGGIADVTGQAVVGLVYFERLKNERAVNVQANVRAELPVPRLRPYVALAYLRSRDRSGNELDIRAHNVTRTMTGGINTRLTPVVALQLTGALSTLEYDKEATFRDVSVAEGLNRRSTTVGGTMRFDLSALTMLMVDVSGGRDDFHLVPGRQSDNLRVGAGLEFQPDAVIRGRVSGGYHKQVSRGSGATPYAGFMASVDLSYALLQRTRFDVRAGRDTQYSALTGEEFYLSTSAGLEVTHNLLGPVDVIGRTSRETLDYSVTPGGASGRIDRATTLGAGVAVRVTPQTRASFNLDYSDRRSSAGRENEFLRRRFFTTLTVGF